MLIPEDVKARLIEAATELMREQAFEPLSERDIEVWLARNSEAVTQRAKDLQNAMFEKYLARRGAIDSAISQSVYRRIRGERR